MCWERIKSDCDLKTAATCTWIARQLILNEVHKRDLRKSRKLCHQIISPERRTCVLRMWRRNLALHGQVAVIRTLALSKLTCFLMNLSRPPDQHLEEIDRMCYEFLWDGKKIKIKKSVVVNSHQEGGLGMVDLQTFNKTKLSWMKRLLQGNR